MMYECNKLVHVRFKYSFTTKYWSLILTEVLTSGMSMSPPQDKP